MRRPRLANRSCRAGYQSSAAPARHTLNTAAPARHTLNTAASARHKLNTAAPARHTLNTAVDVQDKGLDGEQPNEQQCDREFYKRVLLDQKGKGGEPAAV